MVAAASVPITVAREMKRCPAGTDDVALAGVGMEPVTSWSNDVLLRVAGATGVRVTGATGIRVTGVTGVRVTGATGAGFAGTSGPGA
jgi:hypothetical protein